ncbi:glycoside hydrolase family 24 protein [Paraburkholderia sp. GAS82]|uniref:glycoside hydrolase family 24 protein n=1 Tax=Paraburkholderia sp. GAS82 TaxID=3035137 RepID=UPI003D219269
MPRISADQAGGLNRCALLDAIAWSEIGPDVLNNSDDGYNVLVGSLPGAVHTFSSYADHPGIFVPACNSDAAGRAQIMKHWWDAYKPILHLPDFSPVSQDLYAIQQLRESHALPLIDAGNLEGAVAAIAHIWASLPGSPYGQHTNTFDSIKAAYLLAGGQLSST